MLGDYKCALTDYKKYSYLSRVLPWARNPRFWWVDNIMPYQFLIKGQIKYPTTILYPPTPLPKEPKDSQ